MNAKCKLVSQSKSVRGKQGLPYFPAISKESVNAQNIHMQLALIPPHSQGVAHKHARHETAIYALEGNSWVRHGHQLEYETEVTEGCFFYIPADIPHLPYNISDRVVRLVIARTDANEQESVILLPELNFDVLTK